MQIPMLEYPKVAPAALPTPYNTVAPQTGLDELAKGTEQFASGLETMEKEQEKRLQHARDKANAVAVNDGLTRYQHEDNSLMHGTTSDPAAGQPTPIPEFLGGGAMPTPGPLANATGGAPGFLQTEGMAAHAQSAPTLEELEKRRQSIRDSLTNDEQKQLFDEKSRPMWEQTRAQVETHAARQTKVAEDASVDGRMDATLRWVANNYAGDDAVIGERVRDVTNLARALDPVKGSQRADAFEAKVAATRMNMYIANQDWRGAQTYFAESKDKLGETAATYQHQINTLKLDVVGETTAQQMTAQAMSPEGKLDLGKAEEMLKALPPGPERDETAKRLEHHAAMADREWNKKVDGFYSSAFTSFLNSDRSLSNVPAATKAWLIQNAPEEWNKLARMEEAEVERTREKRSPKETPEQREAYIELLSDMQARPSVYHDMSKEEFDSTWAHRLSDGGYKSGGAKFVSAKNVDQVKASDLSAYVTEEVKTNPALHDKKKGELFRADFGDAVRGFREKNKREPTLDELGGIRDSVWKTQPAKWYQFGGDRKELRAREEMQVPAAASVPAATPAGMKWQTNKKTGARRLVPAGSP